MILGKKPASMGRSHLVLPNTALADSGDAALGLALSDFTDPRPEGTREGGERRLFGPGGVVGGRARLGPFRAG